MVLVHTTKTERKSQPYSERVCQHGVRAVHQGIFFNMPE